MNSQTPKTSKFTRPSPPPPSVTKTPPSSTSTSTSSRSSFSLSSHLAMVDLKQKILTSISKLSDRDTHQIAIDDLEKIIQTLTSDGVSVFLNCLFDSTNDPKPTVKKESLRLLGSLCTSHTDFTATHLTKIISFIVKRLKDSDSSVRDSCRDTIGTLSCLYLNGDNGNVGAVLSLFVKPLFEAMGEQNKVVQAASALAMARMVESSVDMPVTVLQKLCPRIAKFLNNQNFLAKAALFSVVSSLSQVKAIAPQNLPSLLQSMHDCLESSEWSTRKAAADTLISLATHSSHLIKDGDGTSLIINKLEACRFDKVKPVRDSMTEALHLLKKISEKNADGIPDDPNPTSKDGKSSEPSQTKILDPKSTNSDEKSSKAANDASIILSPAAADSLSKEKDNSISDKTVGALKKKPHTFSDKELNPEFFQKFETNSGDLAEVVLPHRSHSSSISPSEEESEPNDTDHVCRSNHNKKSESDDIRRSININYHNIERETTGLPDKHRFDDLGRDKWAVQRSIRGKDAHMRAYDVDNSVEGSCREDSCSAGVGLSRNETQVEGSNSKVNWLAIQRQLSQMERQQAHLMNMLQDFMGGSHDGMITLENRVRGLERVVEDMARDLAISSGRRTNNCFTGYEGSSSRTLGKYNGHPFSERYPSSDGIGSGFRGRDSHWRSDVSESWDSYPYNASRNGHLGSRRALGGRSPVRENDGDHVGSRRGWDKGPGSTRLGEGPSARSVWQASKDEATLEAIRVAGEENGTSRPIARVEKELIGEAVGDKNAGQDRGSIWASWSNAMDALQAGDVDLAYGEVLSTADDLLLVKLMDRTGPALDHLSDETANEILHATAQFLLEQNLFDIGCSWIQQLVDLVNENGCEIFNISMERKRRILSNLHEASTAIEPPQDWEGPSPDQLMSQLGSAWGIELQQFQK